jgi:hypothetical protein
MGFSLNKATISVKHNYIDVVWRLVGLDRHRLDPTQHPTDLAGSLELVVFSF